VNALESPVGYAFLSLEMPDLASEENTVTNNESQNRQQKNARAIGGITRAIFTRDPFIVVVWFIFLPGVQVMKIGLGVNLRWHQVTVFWCTWVFLSQGSYSPFLQLFRCTWFHLSFQIAVIQADPICERMGVCVYRQNRPLSAPLPSLLLIG